MKKIFWVIAGLVVIYYLFVVNTGPLPEFIEICFGFVMLVLLGVMYLISNLFL